MQPLRPLRPFDVSVLGSLLAQRGAAGTRLVRRGPVRMGSVAGVGPLPQLALPIRPVRLPPLLLRLRMRKRGLVLMPPPPSGRSGVGGGRSECDCSVSGCDRSPRPGPSGLGSGERSAPRADWYHSEYYGHSSPALSGAAEDVRDSASGSVDLDRDDSFRTVLHLIREFHSMEEPANVAPNWCKTSLTPIYGLQSESSLSLHLPLSSLLRSLLEDTNLALSKFVEDQTFHVFLPVPGRRHQKYYR